jgi:hypothetical protein
MGGPGAPDDMSQAPVTQVWLAVSNDPAATVTGQYFYHQRPRPVHPAATSPSVQDQLLAACAELTGVQLTGIGPTGVQPAGVELTDLEVPKETRS